MLGADGILSKDSDLVAMGGLVIEADFTRQAKDYSRKTAVAVTIKTSGVVAMMVGYGTFKVIGQLIGDAAAQFMRLPPPVKLVVLAAILVIASNERAMQRVMGALAQAGASISKYSPSILEFLLNTENELSKNTVPAPSPTFKSPMQP